mgnify:CR=1 FL=1
MFHKDLPLSGELLYFDLDVIIFRNIDKLFDHDAGKFMIIRDFNRCRVKDWKQSNSSIMRWDTGTMNYLWNDFNANPSQAIGRMHGDQDWIMKRAKDDINHWPDETIEMFELVEKR